MMSEKGIRCELCNVEIPSTASLVHHNEGKKHQKKLEKREALECLAQRSIYVCGVPKNTFSSLEEVENLFSKYGKIEKVHVDITRGSFAIVEYENKLSADAAINAMTMPVGEHIAVIKRRKVDFNDSHDKYEKETIDPEAIIDEVEKIGGSFIEEVENMAKLFCLSEEQIAVRYEDGNELTTALKRYFCPETTICIFGSSVTSIGTADSDVDATLFFGEKPLEEEVTFSELDRNKFTLMTCPTDSLKAHKIRRSEFARLSPADRIRFLGKVLNDIRRHNLLPISDLYLILDARCPLLRFIFKRRRTIDLSVDNRLGVAKTMWIAETVKSDVSCTLRRFLVAVRFWALVHDLLRKDTAMEFFAWFVLLKTKNHVVCPRLGALLTFDEFREAFPNLESEGFKFGHLSIQDPIELSHNIAQLVADKNVGLMRRAMVFSLSSMKRQPDSYISTLRYSLRDEVLNSDLRLNLPTRHKAISECVEEVTRLLTELLSFQVISEPEKKRARLAEDDRTTVNFEVNFRVWSGRRAKRRTILKDNPSLTNWEIEKMVTKLIMTEEVKDQPVGLLLRTTFYAVDGNLTIFLDRLSGSELDLHNLGHFLCQFLPKYFPDDEQNIDSQMEM